MLAVTSDKALLRAIWEIVDTTTRSEVPLSEAAAVLRRSNGAVDPALLELDARSLEQLGFLRLTGRNGTCRVELTQVGAFLADRLRLPA